MNMKKFFLSISLAATLLTSCNMDEGPAGSLSDESAIISVADALKFRNGLYYQLRAFATGSTIYDRAMQADMFTGVVTNGNRRGSVSLGNIAPGSFGGFWSSPYAYLADVNYFLEKVDGMINSGDYTGEPLAQLKRYRGETYWTRAYYYYFMMDCFCNSFNCINPSQEGTGMPLVTEYSPTADAASYPGRSTLAETAQLIASDLDKALTDLQAFEASGASDARTNLAPNAPYLSSYTVMALQARVALLKQDWTTAMAKAEAVIAGPYRLEEGDGYKSMWTTDQGSELIFVPYGSQAQAGGINATGSAWILASGQDADYVLTSNALDMYDAQNDIRYASFIQTRDLAVGGETVAAPCFVKYPGNPELNSGSTNDLKNKPKMFRLSEMYLILAEAAAEGGNAAKANQALTDLRNARIEGYTPADYTGSSLVDEVRLERAREMIGEGYRISDLRRWKLGFSRSIDYAPEYADVPSILVNAGPLVVYQPGDHRMVYPIPTHEMECNPALKGFQNPGY